MQLLPAAVLITLFFLPLQAHALGAKPNKDDAFKCLTENLERERIVMIEPCIKTIAEPCAKWFQPQKFDLYASCLRGLSFNWSNIIKAGLADTKKDLGTIIHGQVETELNRWRYALRRQCKRLPELEYSSIHLRNVNQRICDVSVNASLAFIILTRPEELLEGTSEQT
ncbi:MAG: hypothetical protein AAF557_27610 [Pseudomonadota bacterium]